MHGANIKKKNTYFWV